MASRTSVPPPPVPVTPRQRVSQDTVSKAVNALLKWKKLKSKEDDEFMYLILTLKKVPPKDRINPHKITIPHSLQSSFSELCLIIDDRQKSNSKSKITSEASQKKIKSEDIPITKVIKLSNIKSDYKSFEAKRKLYDSYDMFFADRRVVPLLPKILGKQFYKKKRKVPVPVDLMHSDWKEQIERGCLSALLCLSSGTCSVVKVGKVSMERGEIVENVMAAIDGVVEVVPKKWGGVRSFHLKFSESLALPIYQKLPDMELKKSKTEGVKENKSEKKGRMRYMDVEEE